MQNIYFVPTGIKYCKSENLESYCTQINTVIWMPQSEGPDPGTTEINTLIYINYLSVNLISLEFAVNLASLQQMQPMTKSVLTECSEIS